MRRTTNFHPKSKGLQVDHRKIFHKRELVGRGLGLAILAPTRTAVMLCCDQDGKRNFGKDTKPPRSALFA